MSPSRRELIVGAAAAALVRPARAAPSAVPFGFWGLQGFWNAQALRGLSERLGMTTWQTAGVDPDTARAQQLAASREAGVSVCLRLCGAHSRYTTEAGDFDLDAWTEQLKPWAGRVQDFVDDGTLCGHMLLDDIGNFPGRDPTGQELEEMARRSKELLPGLMCFVRERATAMPEPPGGRYQQVDCCVNQYKSLDGPVEDWAESTWRRAEQLGLACISGLNLCDGGDGSSLQPGWRQGRWAMTGAEIRRYGRVMAQVPGIRMFLCWEYDGQERWTDGSLGTTWLDQPAQAEALAELGALLRA